MSQTPVNPGSENTGAPQAAGWEQPEGEENGTILMPVLPVVADGPMADDDAFGPESISFSATRSLGPDADLALLIATGVSTGGRWGEVAAVVPETSPCPMRSPTVRTWTSEREPNQSRNCEYSAGSTLSEFASVPIECIV